MKLKYALIAVLSMVFAQQYAYQGDQSVQDHPFNAIESADDTAVTAMLEMQQVDINATNQLGQTPLIVAAKLGLVDIVRILIAHGANLNAIDVLGQTALIKASGQGHKLAMRVLLQAGADPNITDDSGQTALIKILRWKQPDDVHVLLVHDADPNIEDNFGKTALIYAAEQNIRAIIKELLLWGATAPREIPDQIYQEQTLELIRQAQIEEKKSNRCSAKNH